MLRLCDFLNDSSTKVFSMDLIFERVVCLNFSLLFEWLFRVIIIFSNFDSDNLSLLSILFLKTSLMLFCYFSIVFNFYWARNIFKFFTLIRFLTTKLCSLYFGSNTKFCRLIWGTNPSWKVKRLLYESYTCFRMQLLHVKLLIWLWFSTILQHWLFYYVSIK